MSLKLGNTNIAGTQILYSTTGNNTDGAMTQKATTDELNNCVHKTGNETISGEKVFTNIVNQKTNYDVTNTSTFNYGILKEIFDKNMEEIGIECVEMRSNILTHYIDARRTVNGQWYGSGLKARLNLSTFEAWAEAPASDISNSIVTTISKSKTQNGYFKLGNGLIIQWGRSSTTDGYVSFPTPFSNACTAVIPTRISSGDAQSNIFENASTTRFKVKIYGGYSSSSYFYWIAVGY